VKLSHSLRVGTHVLTSDSSTCMRYSLTGCPSECGSKQTVEPAPCCVACILAALHRVSDRFVLHVLKKSHTPNCAVMSLVCVTVPTYCALYSLCFMACCAPLPLLLQAPSCADYTCTSGTTKSPPPTGFGLVLNDANCCLVSAASETFTQSACWHARAHF
jgi:hypothetical protein